MDVPIITIFKKCFWFIWNLQMWVDSRWRDNYPHAVCNINWALQLNFSLNIRWHTRINWNSSNVSQWIFIQTTTYRRCMVFWLDCVAEFSVGIMLNQELFTHDIGGRHYMSLNCFNVLPIMNNLLFCILLDRIWNSLPYCTTIPWFILQCLCWTNTILLKPKYYSLRNWCIVLHDPKGSF